MQRPYFLTAAKNVKFVDEREFDAAAVAQEIISFISLYAFLMQILLIFLHLILRPSFLNGKHSAYGINLLWSCRLTILSMGNRTRPPLFAYQAVRLSSLSAYRVCLTLLNPPAAM